MVIYRRVSWLRLHHFHIHIQLNTFHFNMNCLDEYMEEETLRLNEELKIIDINTIPSVQ